MKKHILSQFALLLIALALSLTAANATVGTVNLAFSPLSSAATSPGSSVTLSLSMTVAGFADPDRVGGFDITLTSLNSSSGAFFIQTRTTDTAGAFPDPVTTDTNAV